MDWGKAKNILIVALLVTNLVLLGTYVLRETQRFGADDDDTLRRILTEYKVFIETELPKQPGPMAVLYVRPETEDGALIEEALAEQAPIPNEDREAMLRAANAVLERCGFMTENTKPLTPPETEGGETILRYRNMFGDIPIEESYILCTIRDGRVAKLSRKWYTPLELHDTRGKIIKPIEALMQLLPEKDKEEALIVRDVELVYRVNPDRPGVESFVGDTALPAWKITDSNGSVSYVDAYAQ
ncbi:MAG: hypothetical protein LBE16_07505 [Clostridiales Family XIII bacterium]|jgi:hypothetical protein|nr:hypothetical protein [Clostridiales Family XIII bacterium]